MPLHTFTIDEATISVFPVDANGAAITDNPVWLGAAAKQITITDSLEVIEDRPSGALYPTVHHGAETHEITIARIWEQTVPVVDQPENLSIVLAGDWFADPPANGADYLLRANQEYIIILLWSDADDPQRFTWRCYYKAFDISYELAGQIADENGATHKFRAGYYLA